MSRPERPLDRPTYRPGEKRLRRWDLFLGAVLVGCVAFPLASVQESTRPPSVVRVAEGALGHRLDTYLQGLSTWGFSGVALVAEGEEILLEAAYGWRDAESSEPMTPETVFDVGSLTKQFTSAAVLQLAEADLLDLNESIAAYLDGVPLDKAAITPHHLLSHTSGVPREVAADFTRQDREAFVAHTLGLELAFEPGAATSYSNAGYSLLAAMVESVSGVDFQSYVAERILRPAGMTRSGFTSDPPPPPIAEARGGPLDGQDPTDWPHTWQARGSGGMLATARDLHRWQLALDRGQVLPPHRVDAMRTPVSDGYGYGVGVSTVIGGVERVGHSGLWYAFSSELRSYPGESTVVVVLSNDGREQWASLVRAGIEEILFGYRARTAPALAEDHPDPLETYEGVYELEGGGHLRVRAADDALQVLGEGQRVLDVLGSHRWGDRIFADVNRATVEILRGVDHGDFGTLARTAPEERYRRYSRILPTVWQQWSDSLGPLQEVELIGTVADGGLDALWSTFARLVFRDGSEGVMLTWSPEGVLMGLTTGDPPFYRGIVTFRPSPDGRFRSFNPWTGASVRIGFEGGPSGLRVELEGPGGTVRGGRTEGGPP